MEQGDMRGLFDARDQAVLCYAEELTRQARASQETAARLKDFLSPSQIIVLTAAIGLANLTNRVNGALAIELP